MRSCRAAQRTALDSAASRRATCHQSLLLASSYTQVVVPLAELSCSAQESRSWLLLDACNLNS
jgi:hypothetical protein